MYTDSQASAKALILAPQDALPYSVLPLVVECIIFDNKRVVCDNAHHYMYTTDHSYARPEVSGSLRSLVPAFG